MNNKSDEEKTEFYKEEIRNLFIYLYERYKEKGLVVKVNDIKIILNGLLFCLTEREEKW